MAEFKDFEYIVYSLNYKFQFFWPDLLVNIAQYLNALDLRQHTEQ